MDKPIPTIPDAEVPEEEDDNPLFVITEDLHTPWRYHYSPLINPSRGICGDPTMPSTMPLSAWGSEPGRFTWCVECEINKKKIAP